MQLQSIITCETAHCISSGFLALDTKDAFDLCNTILTKSSQEYRQPAFRVNNPHTFTTLMNEAVKVSEAIRDEIGYDKVITDMGNDLAFGVDIAIAYILNLTYLAMAVISEYAENDVIVATEIEITGTSTALISYLTANPTEYSFGTMLPNLI